MLKLFRTEEEESKDIKFLINGFPATIRTWTPKEWELLPTKPDDAQKCNNGVYITFRMD